MATQIEIPKDEIAAFCRRNGIRKLWVFGSALREDFRPDSDVDLLVDFQPDARAGLLDMAAMEIELGEMLGRKVDLRTPAEISRYFRKNVLESAELQYDAG
jgi:predicted nucleotidyltransferase